MNNSLFDDIILQQSAKLDTGLDIDFDSLSELEILELSIYIERYFLAIKNKTEDIESLEGKISSYIDLVGAMNKAVRNIDLGKVQLKDLGEIIKLACCEFVAWHRMKK